jgi:hypothetical protein
LLGLRVAADQDGSGLAHEPEDDEAGSVTCGDLCGAYYVDLWMPSVD